MPDTSKPPSRYSPLLTEALKGASFTTPDATNCFKAFWSAAVLFTLSLEGLPLSRCKTLVRRIDSPDNAALTAPPLFQNAPSPPRVSEPSRVSAPSLSLVLLDAHPGSIQAPRDET